MDKKQRDVGIFLRQMGHVVPDMPELPQADPLFRKRLALMDEELAEIYQAVYQQDLAQIGGEICDLIYAAYAFAEACGLDLDPFWKRIQDANMEKEPNPNGKPIKGADWKRPDLRAALKECKEKNDGSTPFYPAWYTDAQRFVKRMLEMEKMSALDVADFGRIMARHLPG